MDGPHVVDVLVGRFRSHVAELCEPLQFHLAQDAVPGPEFSQRLPTMALALARPALALGQWVVVNVSVPGLAAGHGEAAALLPSHIVGWVRFWQIQNMRAQKVPSGVTPLTHSSE